MNVIEVNVITGEVTTHDYTEQDLENIAATSKEEQAMLSAEAARQASLTTVEQKLAAVGLTVNDIKAAVSEPMPATSTSAV